MMIDKSLLCFLDAKQRKEFYRLLCVFLFFSFIDSLGLALIIPYIGVLQNAESLVQERVFHSVLAFWGMPPTGFYLIFSVTAAYLFLITFRLFLHIYVSYQTASFPYKLFRDKSIKLYGHYLRLESLQFISLNSNYLVKNCTKTAESAAYAYNLYLKYLVSFLTIAFLIVLVLYRNFFLSLFFVSFFFLLGAILYRSFKNRQYCAGVERENTLNDFHRRASESFLSFKEIRLREKERYFTKCLKDVVFRLSESLKVQAYYTSLPPVIVEYAVVFMLLGVVFLSFAQNIALSELVPHMIFYAAVAKRLLPSINLLLSSKVQLKGMLPAVDLLMEEYKKGTWEKKVDRGQRLEFCQELEFKDIYFAYNERRTVLNKLNFRLRKNQSTAFVGHSGSGKSTFVEIFVSLLEPSGGEIFLDGKKISDMKVLRHRIGYVPQMVNLFDDTIARNIAFGEEEIDKEKLEKSIRMAHLEGFVEDLPRGLETEIGERGVNISGGQRQRIGIARALYFDPQILVFDEATSSLDNVSEKIISETIKALSGKKTMIVVAHRLSTIKDFEKIHVLHHGKIISSGNHQELLSTCDVYQELNWATKEKQEEKLLTV